MIPQILILLTALSCYAIGCWLSFRWGTHQSVPEGYQWCPDSAKWTSFKAFEKTVGKLSTGEPLHVGWARQIREADKAADTLRAKLDWCRMQRDAANDALEDSRSACESLAADVNFQHDRAEALADSVREWRAAAHDRDKALREHKAEAEMVLGEPLQMSGAVKLDVPNLPNVANVAGTTWVTTSTAPVLQRRHYYEDADGNRWPT